MIDTWKEWIGKIVIGKRIKHGEKQMGAGRLIGKRFGMYVLMCGEHRRKWVAHIIQDPNTIEQKHNHKA